MTPSECRDPSACHFDTTFDGFYCDEPATEAVTTDSGDEDFTVPVCEPHANEAQADGAWLFLRRWDLSWWRDADRITIPTKTGSHQ